MKGFRAGVLERDKTWTIEGLSRVASRKGTKDFGTKGDVQRLCFSGHTRNNETSNLCDLALLS